MSADQRTYAYPCSGDLMIYCDGKLIRFTNGRVNVYLNQEYNNHIGAPMFHSEIAIDSLEPCIVQILAVEQATEIEKANIQKWETIMDKYCIP